MKDTREISVTSLQLFYLTLFRTFKFFKRIISLNFIIIITLIIIVTSSNYQ